MVGVATSPEPWQVSPGEFSGARMHRLVRFFVTWQGGPTQFMRPLDVADPANLQLPACDFCPSGGSGAVIAQDGIRYQVTLN